MPERSRTNNNNNQEARKLKERRELVSNLDYRKILRVLNMSTKPSDFTDIEAYVYGGRFNTERLQKNINKLKSARLISSDDGTFQISEIGQRALAIYDWEQELMLERVAR